MKLQARIRDWAILALLLLISLSVTINQNAAVTRPLRALSLQVTSGVESQFARVGEFIRALDENGAIRAHNIVLSSQVARLREAEHENARLRSMLGIRDSLDTPVMAVRVVARDVHRQKNFIIIDAGRADGLQKNMAVIDDHGILGKVVMPGEDYALVQSYLNTDFRVPGLIQAIETFGIVRWDGTQLDRLVLDYVVRTDPVEKGQLVVTAGSSVFPSGVPIGTIDSVATRSGENLLQIFLRPATRIGAAKHAFVVLKVPDEELIHLQTRTP